jgi:HK97 family phage portal protein
MLGSLARIANELGSSTSASHVGEAATNLQMRKPFFNNTIDPRLVPEADVGAQLDSFRGTVYAAVDKIARRVAQIPVRLWQCEHNVSENSIEETDIKFHPFLTLFSNANGRKPHEEYSVWELDYVTSVSMDMTGESWWLVERDRYGCPARVTPLPANRMTIVISKETGLTAGYIYVPKGATADQGGIFVPKRSWQYLHANPTDPFVTFRRYPSPRGIEDARGWSPIKAAAYAYDINLFESIYKRNFLQQGAQLGGILQSEVALSKEQIEEYLEQFKSRHGGVGKAGLPMVLPKMLKWTTTEPTPRDLQWVEAMKLTEGQILQTFGISDAKLGRADIGNRNTADAMDVTFNREVIQSRLDVAVASLNADFLPIYPGQSDQLYFTARFDDPVPADGEAQLKREHQDITNNVITRNELRANRKLKPLGKFGDQVLVPIASVPMDPWDEGKLEISQDDADKMGYIDPEDQAEMDAKVAKEEAKVAVAQAKTDGKDEAKKPAKTE